MASLSLSKTIRSLSLGANGLKTPAQVVGLFNLTFLQELDLSNNYLTTLTPGFVQLRNLQVLNVANNELTKINEIYYLSKLRDFDASGNNLSLDSI